MFADYIKERKNMGCVESDIGFATYSIFDTGECYIEDIYVKPEHRISGAASKLADEIIVKAKEQNCTVLTGSVVPSAKGSTTSLKVLLAYGFQLHSCREDFIVFSMGI